MNSRKFGVNIGFWQGNNNDRANYILLYKLSGDDDGLYKASQSQYALSQLFASMSAAVDFVKWANH